MSELRCRVCGETYDAHRVDFRWFNHRFQAQP